jgi:hypothetical protein
LLRDVGESVGSPRAGEADAWASRRHAPAGPSIAERLLGWLRGLAWPAPAWNYAIIALLLVPAALGVRTWLGPGPEHASLPVRSLPAPQIIESRDQRSVGRTQIVSFLPGEPLLLEIHVPVLEDPGVRYDARLFTAAGRDVWSEEDLQSTDAYGTFLLLFDSRKLAPGRYRLVVTERERERVGSGDAASEFSFSFELAPR